VKKSGIDIKKTYKQLGEWAELCFMARAADRGLNVSKPHGDSASYDVGVEQNGRFLRIQVKSTRYQKAGSFICNIVRASQQERYSPGMLDFFAVYLAPIDLWTHPVRYGERHQDINSHPTEWPQVLAIYGSVELAEGAAEESAGSTGEAPG
jgi:hypothetical protein